MSAAEVSVNGHVAVERAVGMPLDPDIVRDGEVGDVEGLAESLRALFHDGGLDKHVRLGMANQRTVLRTLELPPISDPKELAAAVRFQAEDEVPMPLANAVLDFQPMGLVETPQGPRERVVLVAAQRDLVQRMLEAVRLAGLRAEGVDLAAFALIRALYRSSDEHAGRLVYVNVGGLTNLAVADGRTCVFTRVVGYGLEGIAGELAARHEIPTAQARALLRHVDLTLAPEASVVEVPPAPEPHDDGESPVVVEHVGADDSPATGERQQDADDARAIVLDGVREIAAEVRNSLDFHQTQGAEEAVTGVVLSGAALEIAGFDEALEQELGLPVRAALVHGPASAFTMIPASRLAIAAGLGVEEVPA